MTAQAPPQVLSRRGNANNAKGRGADNAGNKSGKDKGPQEKPETTKHQASKPSKPKAQNEGEKLVIRRLPPGMTQTEFVSILGSNWEVDKGKVDWLSYAPGKVSTDPAKPSRPSRAYIHVKRKDDIMSLSEIVQSSTWEDAKATFTSPALIGPPTVEFAIYKKIPSNKRRTDARQGTIDQDPQFIAFLENLVNPGMPNEGAEAEETDEAEKLDTKVTTTPLIEFLKEKKASKGKDSFSGKNSKRDKESNASKGKGSSKDDESSKKKGKGTKDEKSEKGPKETVKILTKKAATEQAVEAAKNAANHITAAASAETPKSRRAGIAAAARILQRDLGLSPGSAHRRARQDAAKAEADSKDQPNGSKATSSNSPPSATTADRSASPAPSVDSTSQPSKQQGKTGRRNRGGKNAEKGKATESTGPAAGATAANPPVILKKKPEPEPASSASVNESTAAGAPQSAQPTSSKHAQGGNAKGKSASGNKKAPAVSSNATRAFVKHANASQGVTEATLKQALESFGAITFVEIDKRKGFAYVDFSDREALVKAIAASPVVVGQANVQILERKEKKPAAANQGGGGGGGGASSPSTGASTSNTQEKPEKSSGRGRRGRGGGNKAGAGEKSQSQTQGQATNSAPAATPNANATEGG